ncbi:MAG: ABC transporter ATP-binding protein [Clostridiales bacterium]|jgi:putative ABC transport system ATP-binding protein|nr:ABC transporter ATP-binding protein [Clostridiales bacterium]
MIECANLCKSYAERGQTTPVLRAFSFRAEPGEFIALTGRSGCGKSTFLHILCGLLRPDSGVVRVAGRDLTAMREKELCAFRARRLGIVFQDGNLADNFSVEENVLLPFYLTGRKIDAAARAEAEAVMGELGLLPLRRRGVHALSGGQRQKAAIARAVLNKPEILFADEPTGSLDGGSEAEILEIFSRLNKGGATIVMVTHSPACAAVAGRVVRLD